ncbi:MAG: ABC transporter ATP-binding protein [Lachnospiraceae bacterium]|nr:ABC transporter ATP-binding protein [Lachnospiraceae bacterium]
MKENGDKKEKNDMQDKKEENPLHKNYGIFSNIHYILRNMIHVDRHFIIIMLIGFVTAPFMQYMWTVGSKYVIDAITEGDGWRNLFDVVIVFGLVQIVLTLTNAYYNSHIWWRYIKVRMIMTQNKNLKVMRINFEHLENPDVMDCYAKAEQAVNNNNNGVEGMMRGISETLNCISIVIVGIVILGYMNLYILLFITAMSALNFIFMNYTNKKTKKIIWDNMASWNRKYYYMRDAATDFAAAKDIRLLGLSGWLCAKFRGIMLERYDAQRTNEKYWNIFAIISSVNWLILQVVIYAYLLSQVVGGKMTIGNFSLYLTSFATFSSYVSEMLRNISGLLARSREVDDFRSFADFDGGGKESGILVPESDEYEFEFKNVSFRYPKTDKYALKNINLTMKPGERLAVVGLNGAGKTTFIKLLLRLYEPTEGKILLNGVDVRQYDRDSYYKIFSPVFQSVELFAFPMAENVSMKTPEQTDMERAGYCLCAAGLEEKLKNLPQGIHTELLKVIYDDGVDLSGGEKQKLALARALYKDAPVVILDEPTAALDALAESRLYEDFDKLIGGKTAVYISHRLSSTQFCNHVAMFVDGKMMEYGTHKQLLEKGGEYANMYNIQAQYYVKEGGLEHGC